MRHRLEDLGRIAALIDQALEDPVFNIVKNAEKHFYEYEFSKKTSDQQEDIIDEFAYGISRIKDRFYHLLSISEGTDDLNALFHSDPMDS